MDFFTLVGLCFIIYVLVYMVLLCIVDCDIGLAIAEIFGRKLGKLQGKVIWLTGASSGIGEGMAYEIAKNGGKLILSARREDELVRVRDRCLELNSTLTNKDVLVLPMDVTKTDLHKHFFDKVIHHFGTLDILINNAGRSQRATWEDIELAVDRQMFELNVFGVVSLSRIVVKYFSGKGKGYLAVTSSLAGIIGAPFSGTYTGTKHALHGYYESLRNEKLGSKLHITMLCPGPVYTNFLAESFTANPDEKFGQPASTKDRRMTPERCAKLSLIAIVNKLDEAWMALFPVIPMIYALIYCPNITKKIAKYVGAKGLQKMRDSKVTVQT